MDTLTPEDLYDERGQVDRLRPILQGDVFEGVILPCLAESPQIVMLVDHPCSMRRGSQVNERLLVAPVTAYSRVSDWNGHGKVMPLPDLYEDGGSFAAKFTEQTSAESGLLSRDNRVASLTHRGIGVLQQRIIRHMTRFEVPLPELRRQSNPVLTEAEIEWDWLDIVFANRAGVPSPEEIARASSGYQTWLDQESRRERLQQEDKHASLRREAKSAADMWARNDLQMIAD